jgi:hypothetical protein
MRNEKNSGGNAAVSILVFLLCCVAELFVVRTAWTGRQIVEGQVRRGYFERLDGEVGLAVDNAIRPIFPSCVLMDRGELAVPPGMSAVVPLGPGAEYDVATDSALAPYVMVAAEAPVDPAAEDSRLMPGEARLLGGRILALQEGRLALVARSPDRPWREDAARLSALRAACAEHDAAAPVLSARTSATELQLHLGRCSLVQALPPRTGSPLQLVALAGPDWITIRRRPGWIGERWIVWPLVAIVIAKVAVTWWGVGLASAAALSGALGGMAFLMPVPATLTWPLTLVIGAAAAVLRAAVLVLRRLPSRWRVPAALAVIAMVGVGVATHRTEPRWFPPVWHRDQNRLQPDTCAVIGYSAAGGAGLRSGHGGVSVFLDEGCEPCRAKTGSLSAGGETLAWARDAYCASESSFATDGHVIFFGGANDDFFWGLTSVARLFVVGEQGIDRWRRSQAPAAAASLARIEAQTSALEGLMRCAHLRHAGFLFLHDFLVTDMSIGREADRAAMLARRRAAVEEAGGTFVDLLDIFRDQAGIAWFNDYVHPSAVAHERFAELVCGLIS